MVVFSRVMIEIIGFHFTPWEKGKGNPMSSTDHSRGGSLFSLALVKAVTQLE